MQPPVFTADIVALLQRIALALEALPRDIVREGHRGASLTREDRDRLAVLLPAVSLAVGSAIFTVRDLVGHAKTDAELQAVIDKQFGTDAGAPKKLGKLLARCDGFAEEGLRVAGVRKVRDGMLWRVERLS